MLQYCFRILFSTASLNNVLSRPFTWFKKKKKLKEQEPSHKFLSFHQP